MVEFDVERECANGEQKEREVRFHERIEDAFLQSHVKSNDRFAGQIERMRFSVEALEGLALHLAEQVVWTRSDVVDEMLRECLLLGERL